MIDNILDLIKAATSSQSVDMEAVVENCHPLGMLEPAVMKSILAYEDLGEDFHSLYRTILVDTPVGKYFTQFLQESVDEKAVSGVSARRMGLLVARPWRKTAAHRRWVSAYDGRRMFVTSDVDGATSPCGRPRIMGLCTWLHSCMT